MPPLVPVAVKVTDVPAQMVVLGLAVMLTPTVADETVRFDVAEVLQPPPPAAVAVYIWFTVGIVHTVGVCWPV